LLRARDFLALLFYFMTSPLLSTPSFGLIIAVKRDYVNGDHNLPRHQWI
jgi:hypothetical protein